MKCSVYCHLDRQEGTSEGSQKIEQGRETKEIQGREARRGKRREERRREGEEGYLDNSHHLPSRWSRCQLLSLSLVGRNIYFDKY